MAEHATKKAVADDTADVSPAPSVSVSLAGPGDQAVPSPARSLQSGLELEISRAELDFSMREVLSVFIVFCFAAWWALYMLVASLV